MLPVRYAYATNEELAVMANESHRRCESQYLSALEDARDVGFILHRAKEKLPHGGFLPWMQEYCEFSETSANRYMRIASEWQQVSANPSRVTDLTLRAALKAIGAPRERTTPTVSTDEVREILQPPKAQRETQAPDEGKPQIRAKRLFDTYPELQAHLEEQLADELELTLRVAVYAGDGLSRARICQLTGADALEVRMAMYRLWRFKAHLEG